MKMGALKPPPGARRDTKRRGRGAGSGLGKNAGRGDKGYHSRSGSKRRPWFEGGQMPLHRRLPKRGFSNARFRQEYQIVNLKQIAQLEETTIDPQLLYQKGFIHSALQPVKILADGELTRAVEVSATAFSARAREKIEAAGGSVTVL